MLNLCFIEVFSQVVELLGPIIQDWYELAIQIGYVIGLLFPILSHHLSKHSLSQFLLRPEHAGIPLLRLLKVTGEIVKVVNLCFVIFSNQLRKFTFPLILMQIELIIQNGEVVDLVLIEIAD